MTTSVAPTRVAATEENASVRVAATEEHGLSESTDNEWQRLATNEMSEVSWEAAGDYVTPFLDAPEQSPSSTRRPQQGVSRQSPY